MDLARKSEARLPLVSLESEVIGTKELQKVSSKYLDTLSEKGPQVVSVGGVKRAVLVDFNQYIHFQNRFKEIFKEMSVINQILPRIPIPEGHRLQIDELKLEISGTLKKIVAESPESSPFADLMDAILGVAAGLFQGSIPAPAEMRAAAKHSLKSPRVAEKASAKPKRNFRE